MLIFSHIGDAVDTIKNYREDINGIEIDLRMTRDNVVVLSHDRRVQHGDGRYFWIDRLTYSELVSIYGSHFPTFEDALIQLASAGRQKDMILDLDLKQSGMEEPIAALVKKYRFPSVLASSPDIWTLVSFENALPSAQLELTYHPHDRWDLWNIRAFRYLAVLAQFSLKPFLLRLIRRKTAKRDIDYASISYRLVSPEVVRFFHEYDIKVLAWGNDSEKQLRRLIDLEVDGIKTKKPALVRTLLDERKRHNK